MQFILYVVRCDLLSASNNSSRTTYRPAGAARALRLLRHLGQQPGSWLLSPSGDESVAAGVAAAKPTAGDRRLYSTLRLSHDSGVGVGWLAPCGIATGRF